MIEKYKNLLNAFERVILNSKNEELKEMSKESYASFTYELVILENNELSIYEEKMKSLNISEEIIKSTIDNIKKFQIKEQKSDENNVQDDLLSDEPKKEELSEKKENNEDTVETSKEENIEEYIFLNIYRNKDSKIGDEYHKLVLKLKEDLKNANDKLIKTWVNNYMAFANHYKNELDKDKLIKYMYELFKKFDKENKYTDKLPKFINEIERDSLEKDNSVEESIKESKKDEKNIKEEPLKILNIKKSFKSKAELAILGTTALIGLAVGSSGLVALPIAAIIYKLYKSKGLTNHKLKKFLKENDYTIDEETKELKDKNGEVITEETIGKSKYEMLKQYLLKIANKKDDGTIKTEYKKNKIASKLLNSKFVEKLKNITKKNKKEEIVELEELEENQDIQKGMGKC